ncbi:ATP synthase F1 subunit delta [Flavobacteriaceae bacterium R38]|nr:ATP synthase F1 subunit delta [Flavobacteriaceae bacterium R38]
MAEVRAAIRYAKAIIGLAEDQKATDAVNDDMKTIVKTLAENSELRSLLVNPVIKSEIKRASLKAIFSKVQNVTEGAIDVLIQNKRIDTLGAVAEKYIFLYDQLRGKEVAVVTTAVPLSGALEKKVLAKVKELTGNDVQIENKVDKDIIGGFILRLGDLQYNASIANKLSNLKRDFINN